MLNEKYTNEKIISTLRNMNVVYENEEGYIPLYTRTNLTDELHEKYEF